MNDPIPDDEAFEYAYLTFIQTIEILAMDAPDLQCQAQGNFNIAWELKSDVTAGSYMFNLPDHPLTVEQKGAILAFVTMVGTMPESVLSHKNDPAGNFAAMSDPWWIPVNAQAKKLITLLEPATKKNREYFASLG